MKNRDGVFALDTFRSSDSALLLLLNEVIDSCCSGISLNASPPNALTFEKTFINSEASVRVPGFSQTLQTVVSSFALHKI